MIPELDFEDWLMLDLRDSSLPDGLLLNTQVVDKQVLAYSCFLCDRLKCISAPHLRAT